MFWVTAVPNSEHLILSPCGIFPLLAISVLLSARRSAPSRPWTRCALSRGP